MRIREGEREAELCAAQEDEDNQSGYDGRQVDAPLRLRKTGQRASTKPQPCLPASAAFLPLQTLWRGGS